MNQLPAIVKRGVQKRMEKVILGIEKVNAPP